MIHDTVWFPVRRIQDPLFVLSAAIVIGNFLIDEPSSPFGSIVSLSKRHDNNIHGFALGNWFDKGSSGPNRWFGLRSPTQRASRWSAPTIGDRQPGATRHGIIAPWTIWPPTIVRTTAVFPTFLGATVKMSCDRTARSANFPTSRLPNWLSPIAAYAEPRV